MSLFQNEKKSLAGTWGDEIKTQYYATNHIEPQHTLTNFRESYNVEKFEKAKEDNNNKFMKFRTLKSSGAAILDSQKNTNNHHNNYNNDEVKLCTNNQSHSKLTLNRTKSKLLSLPDYPVAVGRSGARIEKGVSTSGLLGERLMLEKDPKYNSLAQRIWLYSDDPALHHRVYNHNNNNNQTNNNISSTNNSSNNPEVTFTIGNESKGFKFKGWNYHRKKPIY